MNYTRRLTVPNVPRRITNPSEVQKSFPELTKNAVKEEALKFNDIDEKFNDIMKRVQETRFSNTKYPLQIPWHPETNAKPWVSSEKEYKTPSERWHVTNPYAEEDRVINMDYSSFFEYIKSYKIDPKRFIYTSVKVQGGRYCVNSRFSIVDDIAESYTPMVYKKQLYGLLFSISHIIMSDVMMNYKTDQGYVHIRNFLYSYAMLYPATDPMSNGKHKSKSDLDIDDMDDTISKLDALTFHFSESMTDMIGKWLKTAKTNYWLSLLKSLVHNKYENSAIIPSKSVLEEYTETLHIFGEHMVDAVRDSRLQKQNDIIKEKFDDTILTHVDLNRFNRKRDLNSIHFE